VRVPISWRHRIVGKELVDLLGAPGTGKVESLAQPVPQSLHAFGLFGALDAFLYRVQAQRVRDMGDRCGDRALLVGLSGAVGHERLVQFEDVHRTGADQPQRGLAGAEVVEGQLDPEPPQSLLTKGSGL